VNNLIIVIEGADLVGKSTLIREIKRRRPEIIPIKFDRVPVDLRTDETYGEIMRYADNMVYKIISQIKDKVFVMDRFIVSELIYSNFLKRKPCETIADILNKKLRVIILTAKESVIIERAKQRNEDLFKTSEILKLNKLFYNFYNKNYSKIKYLYCYENNCESDLFSITTIINKMIRYDGPKN